MGAPRGSWLFGHLPAIRLDPLRLLDECRPPVATLRLGRSVHLLLEPADIVHVLRDGSDNYSKGTAFRYGRRLYGNSLLVSEGDEHREQARVVGGLFFRSAARSFIDPAAEVADQLATSWQEGQTIDLWSAANDLTLALSSKAVFGDDWLPPWLRCGSAEAQRMLQAFDAVMGHVARQSFSVFALPDWLPAPAVRRYRQAATILNEAVAASVSKRAAGVASGGFLEPLLAYRDDRGEPLSPAQIRDQSLVMMLGGYESSATALCWMLLLMGQNVAVRERLTHQVRAAIGDRLPTAADLPQIPLASQIVSESLRLYPPPWMIPRAAIREDQLPSGQRIPAGGQVCLSPYRTQRDVRFFPEPLRFAPERFAESATWPDGAYFPFGLGSRHCIAESVARTQLALILITWTRRCYFQLPSAELPRPRPVLTLRPPVPLQVIVRASGDKVRG